MGTVEPEERHWRKAMITSAEREFAIKQLDQTRERLLASIQGLSRDQLLYTPEAGRWSVADNVEHLIVVEERLVGAIERVLQKPVELSKQHAIEDSELIRQAATVVEPLQGPAQSLPSSRWPAEELAERFETARRRTRAFTEAANEDLRHYFFAHPLFGDLDCYQWLLLIGAHCSRHTTQAEAVKASPSFPL
jgi:hypothetical protein